jgi:hypothetical protein
MIKTAMVIIQPLKKAKINPAINDDRIVINAAIF